MSKQVHPQEDKSQLYDEMSKFFIIEGVQKTLSHGPSKLFDTTWQNGIFQTMTALSLYHQLLNRKITSMMDSVKWSDTIQSICKSVVIMIITSLIAGMSLTSMNLWITIILAVIAMLLYYTIFKPIIMEHVEEPATIAFIEDICISTITSLFTPDIIAPGGVLRITGNLVFRYFATTIYYYIILPYTQNTDAGSDASSDSITNGMSVSNSPCR